MLPCKHTAPSDHGFDKALCALDKSLSTLGRSYLDLYLIHWPGAQGKKREDPQNAALRKESWRALEQAYNNGWCQVCGRNFVSFCHRIININFMTHNNSNITTTGKVKAIGVSNYTIHHLKELFTHATIKPHVLQVLTNLQYQFIDVTT